MNEAGPQLPGSLIREHYTEDVKAFPDIFDIRQAEQWGAGSAEVGEVTTLNAPQEGTTYPRASGIVKQLTRNVTADRACSACYAALVRGLYFLGAFLQLAQSSTILCWEDSGIFRVAF